MIDLDELERLAKAATPGPWTEGRHDMKSIVEGCPAKYIYSHFQAVAIACGEDVAWYQVICNAEYIVAACNAVPELIAENRKLEEHAAYLEQVNSDLIAEANEYMKKVRELERQRDWLIHYAWIDTNAPCPYEMGHFDQKKICPCWTPYHDWENAEDMSRDDWHDLLMEGVMTEEDKVNCATDFCECLLAAAEEAAKEAGE